MKKTLGFAVRFVGWMLGLILVLSPWVAVTSVLGAAMLGCYITNDASQRYSLAAWMLFMLPFGIAFSLLISLLLAVVVLRRTPTSFFRVVIMLLVVGTPTSLIVDYVFARPLRFSAWAQTAPIEDIVPALVGVIAAFAATLAWPMVARCVKTTLRRAAGVSSVGSTHCPRCGYDLRGAPLDDEFRCPECDVALGLHTTPEAARSEHEDA